MKYNVKFEFFGHKMQTNIEAKNKEEAKYLIMGKIKFYEVKPISDEVDFLMNIFNMKT